MTIPLLTPETVKNDSQKQEQEQRVRIRDLSIEEDRLIKSINTMREEERSEKERIETGMVQFRAEAKAERDRLSADVTSLESRREEAMKPIQEIRNEAMEKNARAGEREESVAKRDEALTKAEKEFHEFVVEKTEKIRDTEQIHAEREEDLDKRQNRIQAEEDRLKESSTGLAQRWVDFHKAVDAKNAELTSRESAVSAGEQANRIRSAELDKAEIHYKEKDREIKDRYETLASAEREILDGEKGQDNLTI